jgi:multimeric flavodoxin WrbA
MKILILDCVSDSKQVNANVAVSKFVEGLKSAGGDVNIVKVTDLEIKPCFSCTSQSSFQPSDKCRCNDDMNQLYPLFRENNSWIFVTHISGNGSTKYIENILDRLEPLFQPLYLLDSGFDFPPDTKTNGKIMLISSYDNIAADKAIKISDYISSIGTLFAKSPSENILFDNIIFDDSHSEKLFNAGIQIVNNEN